MEFKKRKLIGVYEEGKKGEKEDVVVKEKEMPAKSKRKGMLIEESKEENKRKQKEKNM